MKTLKAKRGQIKGQITRTINYFEKTESASAVDARVYLTRLQELLKQFEEIQTEIKARLNDKNVLKEEKERKLFENSYHMATIKAKTIIDADNKRQMQQAPQIQAQTQGQMQIPQQTNLQASESTATAGKNGGLLGTIEKEPRLSDIKLPKFKGECTKWTFFKNSFETIIHRDNFLTPMQKHQYLAGLLQGEARKVIEGFNISDENYENVWKLLKDKYDNQMMIIEAHLDEVFDFPPITKENKLPPIVQIRYWCHKLATHVAFNSCKY